MILLRILIVVGLGVGLATPAVAIERGKPVHALSMYGRPKHGSDFKHFDFVNPGPPKGGMLTRATEQDRTFDTFNPYTLKGAPARIALILGGALMHDTLMIGNPDEVNTLYGLVAETVEVAADNTWAQFKLRPEAKFSDGTKITAEDAVFSFDTLVAKGRPNFRLYWDDVARAEAIDPSTVKFWFKNSRSDAAPMNLGQLPMLSKAYWSTRDFTAPTLEIPVISGAYTIESFEPGRYVVAKRRNDYWAKNLAVMRGFNNFERIRYDYFSDDQVKFEAFKKGVYDVHRSASARQWATAYDFPAFKEGKVRKLEFTDGTPMTTQTFVFNLRNPLFTDARVREALNYGFDFESLNRTVFFNAYTRIRSYWQKSELEATGLPGPAELAILEPMRGEIPERVFTTPFTQPTTDGKGSPRENLSKAAALLREAGWVVENGKLVKADTKQPFEFEFVLAQANLDGVVLAAIENWKRLGITVKLQMIDSTQFLNRLNGRQFDMTWLVLPYGLSPGNELTDDWGMAAADRDGSRNYGGIKDPALETLAQKIIHAGTREEIVAATRAMDRVLAWNHYRILTYSTAVDRYAAWNTIQGPARVPLTGLGSTGSLIEMLWWAAPAAAPSHAAP
jgi:microcin C transport system substrate-binding protein